MKKVRLYIATIIIVLISCLSYAQNPPDPDPDPNNGGQDLGGNAALGSGLLILTLMGVGYGAWKMLQLKSPDLHYHGED
jgi:hypothetical protein